MLKPTEPLDSAATGVPQPDSGLFREGMSRVAGAVHVVTTDGPSGRAGFTATAVTPLTDSPPSLLICINASGHSVQGLQANQVFCVNTLAAEDIEVAETFAGRAGLQGPDRFTVGRWNTLETGAPLLATSLVAFDCRLRDARLVATHHIVIGAIIGIRLGEPRPALVYKGRAYHRL